VDYHVGGSALGERRPRVLPLPREPTVSVVGGEGRLLAPHFWRPDKGEYTQRPFGCKVVNLRAVMLVR
jgi:hypothetical protein